MYHDYSWYIDVYHIVGMQWLYCCCWFTVSEHNMYNLYIYIYYIYIRYIRVYIYIYIQEQNKHTYIIGDMIMVT